jgi:predicted transcriptional regulator
MVNFNLVSINRADQTELDWLNIRHYLIQREGRRTIYDIYADILFVCQNGLKRTKIGMLTETNLSRLKDYISHLKKMELLSYTSEKPFCDKYIVTEKGIKYIKLYHQLLSLVLNEE